MYHTPQHTGEDYVFHKISAPRNYWAYVEVAVETWQRESVWQDDNWYWLSEDTVGRFEYKETFKDYIRSRWHHHFKDLEHTAYDTEQEARDSLPFVHWQYFWRDCDTHRWRHCPPNKFNDFFEVI